MLGGQRFLCLVTPTCLAPSWLMQVCKLNVQKTFFTLAKELSAFILPFSVSYNTIYRSVSLFTLIQQGLVDI